MEFRLTYEGPLFSMQDESQVKARSHHIHDIRTRFHKQLSVLWTVHPVLYRSPELKLEQVRRDGFHWLPLATNKNGLICRLDVLMLRRGDPGKVVADIDNRLKTIFDALRMPGGPRELGAESKVGPAIAKPDQVPFFTLLEDDGLITSVNVKTDHLLEPIEGCKQENAVRLVLGVDIRPYKTSVDNLDFS